MGMYLDIYCVGLQIPDFVGYYISLVYKVLRIGIPILLIVFGMFDMGKAVVGDIIYMTGGSALLSYEDMNYNIF